MKRSSYLEYAAVQEMGVKPLRVWGYNKKRKFVCGLISLSKNRRHQPRIPAPMKNPYHPQRLLVRCVGDKVLFARDMES